jgi:PhnB protein
MKNIIPEIFVDNCKEALEYYKEIFGGEIKNVQLADGNPMFKGKEGKIIHSELHINKNCIIYLVDILSEEHDSKNVNILLELENEEEINKIYTLLKNKGSVKFELQKTFWGAYHAVVTDINGIIWGLNYSNN